LRAEVRAVRGTAPRFSRFGEFPADTVDESASVLSATATPTACGPTSDKPKANAAATTRTPRIPTTP